MSDTLRNAIPQRANFISPGRTGKIVANQPRRVIALPAFGCGCELWESERDRDVHNTHTHATIRHYALAAFLVVLICAQHTRLKEHT